MSGPIRIFGLYLSACHGLPILVVGAIVAVAVFCIAAMGSRMVPPVTLTGISIMTTPIEDNHGAPPQIKGSNLSVYLSKSGYWTRLCPSFAQETVFDAAGNQVSQSGRHEIDVPKVAGPINHVPRPITLPSTLANAPGFYRIRLDDYSSCWPMLGESIHPIPSTSAETMFQIVP